MPEFATVHCDIECWQCRNPCVNQVDFQWGKVPAGYQLGDSIKWLHIDGELVPSFVLVEGQTEWNSGDCTIDELIVLDCNLYSLDSDVPNSCPTCNAQIASLAVRITNNVVESVVSCSTKDIQKWLGNSSVEADIIVVEDIGVYVPKPQWYDHPIKYMSKLP